MAWHAAYYHGYRSTLLCWYRRHLVTILLVKRCAT